jgi:hypothetical protein
LRSPNQAMITLLAFPESHVIFTALINQTFTSLDSVVEITYDNANPYIGDYTDIEPNMTLWIGSGAGKYDLGIARIRKDATSTKIYIGASSDLHLANNLYLTVVDEMLPWIRYTRQKSNTDIYVDQDISYSDQYAHPSPFVNMGPDRVINKPSTVISIANPATITFDSSGSFMPDGTTIASRAWGALGDGITITNDTIDVPTFHITQTGTWRIWETITGTNGKVTTGWRTLVAFDKTHPPVNQFNLTQSPTTSKEDGGMFFSVKLYDQAAIANVRERQQVILFARDFYTDSSGVIQEISLGPVTDCENVVCIGWIAKESISFDPNGAYVEFTVQGIKYWLDQMPQWILGIDDKDTANSTWLEYYHLTMDLGMASLLYWRSTIPFIADVYLTGDTRAVPSLVADEGSLWSQIKQMAWINYLAVPLCNRYNQLYVRINQQFIPSSSRSLIPLIMDVEKQDLEQGKFKADRDTTTPTAFLAGAAGEYASGSSGIATVRLAFSPGHSYKQWGKTDTLPNIVVTNQAQLNVLNSLYIANSNNPYKNVPLSLASNNRFIDICPSQIVHHQRDAGDSPRDVEFDNNLIPVRVTYDFNAKTGTMFTEISAEAEVFEDLVVTGTVPAVTPPGETPIVPITVPPYIPMPFLPTISVPPTFSITNPAVTTTPIIGPRLPRTLTVIRIDAICGDGTSVTFNLETRSVIGTPGASVMTVDLVATTTETTCLVFSNSVLLEGTRLCLVITDVSGGVTEFSVSIQVVA